MSELLDRIENEIRERLEATRAAVLERERLEAALEALTGTGASAKARVKRSGSATPAGRGSAGQRAPRGANREAVLRVVGANPGLTASEISVASGVQRGTLSTLLRTLVRRGELEKQSLPGERARYAIVSSTSPLGRPTA